MSGMAAALLGPPPADQRGGTDLADGYQVLADDSETTYEMGECIVRCGGSELRLRMSLTSARGGMTSRAAGVSRHSRDNLRGGVCRTVPSALADP